MNFKKKSAFLVLLALLIYLRSPDIYILPQLWAEDGAVFLIQAREIGFLSLFHPYGGYLLIIPRIIASYSNLIPLIYTPLIYTYSSIILLLLLGLYYLSVPLSNNTRIFLLLSIVLVPIKGEIFLNITNVQWLLAPFMLILFYADTPPQRHLKVLYTVALFLIGLTGPFSVFFVPFLILYIFLFERNIYKITNLIVLTMCALIQILFILKSQRLLMPMPNISIFMKMLCADLFFPLFFGMHSAFNSLSLSIGFFVTMAFIAWIFFAILLVDRKSRFVIVTLFSLSISLFYLGLQAVNANPSFSPFGCAPRYFYLPYLFLIWLICYIYFNAPALKKISISWAFLIFFSLLSNYRSPQLENMHWDDCIRNLDQCKDIPINPIGWKINIK
jgi:hypothetical protein